MAPKPSSRTALGRAPVAAANRWAVSWGGPSPGTESGSPHERSPGSRDRSARTALTTPSRSLSLPSASRTPIGTALPASALPERSALPAARPRQADVDVVLVRLRVVHALAALAARRVAGGVRLHAVG